MLLVAPEDRYPEWSDKEGNLDPRLDKLIDDIISDQLVPCSWAAKKRVSKKKKRFLDEQTCMQEKEKKLKKAKKQSMELEISSNVQDKDDTIQQLLKLVGTLVDKVGDMEKKCEGFDGVAEMIMAKLEVLERRSDGGRGDAEHVYESLSSVYKKMEHKEDDGGSNEAPAKRNTPGGGSNKNPVTGSAKTPVRSPFRIPTLNDDSCEAPSWLVKSAEAGSDGLPVTKVVKSVKTVGRSGKAEHEDQLSDDVVDVTEQQKEENLKMASPSGALMIDDEKRIPMLADTQKSPYIPNSTVRRIITGGRH